MPLMEPVMDAAKTVTQDALSRNSIKFIVLWLLNGKLRPYDAIFVSEHVERAT
jgi:hypothetical protein